MNKKTITTMLIICMLVAVAVPSSALAATDCGNNNYSKFANMFTNCDINKTFENFFNKGLFKNQSYTFKCIKSSDAPSTSGAETAASTDNSYSNKANCIGQDCSNKSTCQSNNCNKQNCTSNNIQWWQSFITGIDSKQENEAENNDGNSLNNSNNQNNTNNDNNQGNINITDKTDNKENVDTGEDNVNGYIGQVLSLVNSERAKEGLAPLALNNKLSQVAQAKAADMRDNKYFSHTSPTYGSPFDMMKKYDIAYTAAGENIAKGQRTPESVMNAWMNSSGHRANIMSSSFEQIGIGYTTDSNGNTYWVQMFIR